MIGLPDLEDADRYPMDIWDVWDDKEKSPARVLSVKGHTLSDRPH